MRPRPNDFTEARNQREGPVATGSVSGSVWTRSMDQPSATPTRQAGNRRPKCCHNRNQGLCASLSSCLRLAAI